MRMSQLLTSTGKSVFEGFFEYENKIGDVYERCVLFNGWKCDQIVVYPRVIKLYIGKKVMVVNRCIF